MRPKFNLKSGNKVLELGVRTTIMGVVNITPDSFYDGGAHFKPEDAIAHGNRLLEEGADILDLGGQSTRPASEPVGAQEELRRVLPVLRSLRRHDHAWLSIDTYRSEVAKVCLEEGADMINDVSSFRMDPDLPSIISQFKVPVVCMHFLESIHPMPTDPQYKDLKKEIVEFFEQTFRIADTAEIDRNQLILDPGIGFGKKLEHNLEIIRDLSFLHQLNRPILAGPSRKSFIQKITGLPAESRLEGTAAAAAMCLVQGTHILRVHDVRFFRRFCDVFDVLLHG
jgi:dihydropteroate synthase